MRISQTTSIILLVILIVIIALIFAFKGYAQCECKILYNNSTQSFYDSCTNTGNSGTFFKVLEEGLTGVCQ